MKSGPRWQSYFYGICSTTWSEGTGSGHDAGNGDRLLGFGCAGSPGDGSERSNLQFRLETFNTFSHPQWQGVNTNCNGTTAAGAP